MKWLQPWWTGDAGDQPEQEFGSPGWLRLVLTGAAFRLGFVCCSWALLWDGGVASVLLSEGQGWCSAAVPRALRTERASQTAGRARGASTKAGVLSWLLFVGAVTSLDMAHPACVTAHALGQTDGPLLFLKSFHQLQRDLLV